MKDGIATKRGRGMETGNEKIENKREAERPITGGQINR